VYFEVDRRECARAVRIDLFDAGDRDDRDAIRLARGLSCVQGRTFTSRMIDSVNADP
jgi:hypothetical protein